MKRVVVVGGGYAGVALARALDSTAEVCLVEARDRFVHNVAAIRSVVDPTLLERIVIPYDRLLRRGRVRRGVVTSASEHDVTLASGEVIEADIVVVATGSRYAEPFKPEAESTAAFSDSVRAAHAALLAADKVAIVGGGAVGVELAGEISTIFHNKRVTLVSSSPALMPGYPARLAHSLHTQLRRKGVELRLGTRVKIHEASGRPYIGRPGNQAESALGPLIFQALGARPVTSLFQRMEAARFDQQGRVIVDPWLRPAGLRRLFALGDAAATGDPMTIVAITRQVPWLAKTINALLAGRRVESVVAYKPWPSRGILVPLGPHDGASVLPVLGRGWYAGRCPTALIKGRELFIPRYLKEFGYDEGAIQ
ncbi:MAG: N-acyl homoserine lactone synthase [Caballeronia mineralivorans]|jgi:NADH dehydrogenase FAD-containing subunit|nr:FAD-dependent oxidoreductase [Caballeronia mineralivorans]MDB5781231.1 N-acyl homoserine lactone synthase [Caballeronia mineralivorans]MEA3098152.1 apoptosis-inducing factor 2 [Caballeronia mineralivorans]